MMINMTYFKLEKIYDVNNFVSAEMLLATSIRHLFTIFYIKRTLRKKHNYSNLIFRKLKQGTSIIVKFAIYLKIVVIVIFFVIATTTTVQCFL